MMGKYLLFALVILTFNVVGQISPSVEAKVDHIFTQWNGAANPGAALGIIKDGKLIYTKGYGMADLEHDIPITDSTLFYIGSVSKQFITMCILLLEENGKLNLDDRVQKYLPDFPTYDAPLTIRNFIHHTSGVRDNLTLWSLSGKDYLDHIDKEEIYQLIRRQKELNFKPGEKYMYSNSCYFMLGLIIEKVTGESLHEFARKNIFDPLGMKHTFFQDDNTRIIKNRAFSYVTESGAYKNQIMRYDLVGSGGIYSNVKDLYLWDQNFYHNKLGNGSMALIEKMHTEGMLNNGKSSGYAFAIVNGNYRGLKTVSHSGALAGYRSYLLRFPDQSFSVVILGNVIPININRLPYAVADIMLEKELGPIPVGEKEKSESSKAGEQKVFAAEIVKQYVGVYYSEELDVKYEFTTENSDLYCSINSHHPDKLKAISQDVFGMDESVTIKYDRGSKNQVIGFAVEAGRATNLKFKKIY